MSDNGVPKDVFAEWMGISVDELESMIDYGPGPGEVGHIEEENRELLEYPCNCIYCLEKALTPDEIKAYLNR